MTPVFGCLPLLGKTRIVTVQDYNIKKKGGGRGKRNLAELQIFPTRRDHSRSVVSDANTQNVSEKMEAGWKFGFTSAPILEFFLPKTNSDSLSKPFAASLAVLAPSKL